MASADRLISSALRCAVLALVVAVPALTPRVPAETMLSLGYVAVGISIVVGLARGGLASYAFWVPVIAGAPLITPFIVQRLLGYPLFSAYAIHLQHTAGMAAPVAIGGLSVLYLACAIDREPVRRPSGGQTSQSMLPLFPLVAASVVFFAWLTEPGAPLGFASYTELMTQRIPGTRFAGGAWAAMMVVLTLLYFSSPTERRRRLLPIYALVVLGSMTWLLLHARRSETAGVLILLLAIGAGTRVRLRHAIAIGVLFSAFAAVGYLRSSTPLSEQARREYVQLPGGPGNVLLSYLAAHDMTTSGDFSWLYGTTYVGQVVRLPPEFLGLPRPPTAYEHVEARVPLIGGEFLLVEPWINFGILGILAFLPLFTWCVNASCRAIRNGFERDAVGLGNIVGAVFLALIFRTIWYGVSPAIKSVVIGLMIGWALLTAARVGVPRVHALKPARSINE